MNADDSTFSASALKAVYGIVAEETHDNFVDMLETQLKAISESSVAGKFIVEYIPFLKKIPVWFPVAQSQRLFKKWQAASAVAIDAPYQYAVDHMVGIPFCSLMKATLSELRPLLG